MNDTCFLCLEITRQHQCNTCKIMCHNKCWELYRKKHSCRSNLQIHSTCPQCNEKITDVVTRPITRCYAKTHLEETVMARLEKLLLEYQSSSDLDVQKKTIEEAFECLNDNVWVVEKSEVFKNAVKYKFI